MTAFDATADPAAFEASCLPGPLPDWVFAYGSLIWNPEFDYQAVLLAQVHGYHRSFCIRSTRYRGTPEQPGVVLGLDRGGSCIGMAYRLRPTSQQAALDALFRREMTGGVYVARRLACTLETGERVQALAFVANRESVSYERLSDAEIVARLGLCAGERGCNRDYAIRTWHSLVERGVHCPHLARVGRHLQAL